MMVLLPAKPEPKIFATKALRTQRIYLLRFVRALVAELEKFFQKKHKIRF